MARVTTGTVAYGFAFCVLAPGALAAWAWGLDRTLGERGWHEPLVGNVLVSVGFAILVAGWSAIVSLGDGLPMNAAPPRRWVTGGVFAALPHPIYAGFVCMCAGAALSAGSWAGLVLVTPIAAISCAALWWGYERTATLDRLGTRPHRAWLSLAANGEDRPGIGDVVATWLGVLGPWAVLYLAIQQLPVPGSVETWLPFERNARVWVWSEWAYAAAYPLALAAPALAPTRRVLRRFQVASVLGMAIGFWCFLVLPLVTTPRGFDDDGSLAARLLTLEHAGGLACRGSWPSFHVFWAIVCAWVVAQRAGIWRHLGWIMAAVITASTWTTGMHGVSDIGAGVALALLALNCGCAWGELMAGAAAVANAWHEWRMGPVRVLGYAVWPALAAFTGWLIADGLTGGTWRAGLALIAAGGLLGAGAWGQWLEASSKLARPFGYYGHLIGSIAGLIAAVSFGLAGWPLCAALAVAGPWVMAIGRIRCLTQGCCHGRACGEGVGVIYTQERSRVLMFSDLGHRPIHATQVYSILGNVAIGGLLLRAWFLAAPAALIVGGYFVLSGLLRFVEEHYRGEPQTKVLWGLRAYQWLAVLSVLAGMGISVIPSARVAPAGALDWWTIIAAGAAALAYGACMGVDFPGSNRRFARLA